MSWHFSQVLAGGYSEANYSVGEPYVGWKSIPSVLKDSCNDKTKGTLHRSLYGTMYVPLTDDRGKALLTWYRGVFLANHSATLHTGIQQQLISGRKCFASLKKSTQNSCSLKMLSYHPLQKPQTIAKRWVIKPKSSIFQRQTWVQTTLGKGTGFLHTPTCTANYTAPSMMKHKCCQLFLQAFGNARNPWVAEWLMGYPTGWTDSGPLEMGKFQQWQQQHGQF